MRTAWFACWSKSAVQWESLHQSAALIALRDVVWWMWADRANSDLSCTERVLAVLEPHPQPRLPLCGRRRVGEKRLSFWRQRCLLDAVEACAVECGLELMSTIIVTDVPSRSEICSSRRTHNSLECWVRTCKKGVRFDKSMSLTKSVVHLRPRVGDSRRGLALRLWPAVWWRNGPVGLGYLLQDTSNMLNELGV